MDHVQANNRGFTGAGKTLFVVLLVVFLLLAMIPALWGQARGAVGDVSLCSSDSAGIEGDDWSYYPAVTPDGRYVAFHSDATNLVDPPTT